MTMAARIDDAARAEARARVDGLAKPLGALGRLEDLAVWLAGVQGTDAPVAPQTVSVVVFAGDHGVTGSDRAVSAYPRDVTALMVREFLRGGAAVNVLARAHGARVRVLDLGVDDDLADTPPEVRRHKVRRGSGCIDREDALSEAETTAALSAGAAIADEEIDAGCDLLVPGDMGIGNTTVAATLVGAALGLDAVDVVGRGTGIDDATWRGKHAVVESALGRARPFRDDPAALLRVARQRGHRGDDRVPSPGRRARPAGAAGRHRVRGVRPARRADGPRRRRLVVCGPPVDRAGPPDRPGGSRPAAGARPRHAAGRGDRCADGAAGAQDGAAAAGGDVDARVDH